jgi:hypothetical protein
MKPRSALFGVVNCSMCWMEVDKTAFVELECCLGGALVLFSLSLNPMGQA